MLLNINKTTIPQALEQGYQYALFLSLETFNFGIINLKLYAEKVNSKTFLNQTNLFKYFDLNEVEGPSLRYFNQWIKELSEEIGPQITLIGFISDNFKFRPYNYIGPKQEHLCTEFDLVGRANYKITDFIDKTLIANTLWLKEIVFREREKNEELFWVALFHNIEFSGTLEDQKLFEGITSSFSEDFKNKTIEDIEKECLTYGAETDSTL